MSEQASTQERVTPIPISQIRAGDNDRRSFVPVALQELADSIAAHGLAQPITVRPMRDLSGEWYQIVAGERRYRACALLGFQSVSCLVKALTDIEAASIMLVENTMRADLNPIDEANAYHKRMVQFGWQTEDLAAQAKMPIQRVRARLALLELSDDIQVLVRGGSLTLPYAEAMTSLDHNFQAVAMRYFSETRRPNLTTFRALVNELREKQDQHTLFDIDFFAALDRAEGAAENEREKRKAVRIMPDEYDRIMAELDNLRARAKSQEAFARVEPEPESPPEPESQMPEKDAPTPTTPDPPVPVPVLEPVSDALEQLRLAGAYLQRERAAYRQALGEADAYAWSCEGGERRKRILWAQKAVSYWQSVVAGAGAGAGRRYQQA